MISNHYGYGIRNDELPYAHKILPGGNWRDLPYDERIAFWNGTIPTSGGCTNGLRRMSWDEPGITITTTPSQKLSCQLHPGTDIAEGGTRVYNVIPQRPPNGFTVAELFAGGGLMAAGLHAAGYDIVWANDFDKSAYIAYRHNHGDYIIHGDITKFDPDSIPNVDIIAGGPPCQDYSVAGQGAGEEGERGKLVWTYLSIIERKKPKAFIFENVKGLVGKSHLKTFNSLLSQFNAIGYKVSYRVVNAWEHGVAQKRERVFIVGIRADLGFHFVFPDPLPEDNRTQVLRDVIGDLPDPVEHRNINVNNHINIANNIVSRTQNGKYNGAKPENYVQNLDKPCATVTHTARSGDSIAHPNHDPRELSAQAIAYLHSKGGRSLKKHRPPTLDEPSQTIVSNIQKGVPYGLHYPDNHERKEISEKAMEGYDRRGGPGAFGYRVNDWDEPSPTIFGRIFNEGKAFVHPSVKPENHDGHLFNNVGNNPTWEHANRVAPWDKPAPTRTEKDRCDGIHPKKPRRFTVRECLRIQSVPDWYVFPDSISLSAQYRVVGNGVASRVAYLLGIALADQLSGAAIDNGQIDLFELIEEPNLNRRMPPERTREREEERA